MTANPQWACWLWRALAFFVQEPPHLPPAKRPEVPILGRHEGEGAPLSALTLQFRGGSINLSEVDALQLSVAFQFESGPAKVIDRGQPGKIDNIPALFRQVLRSRRALETL